jgi:hypothetical protein
MALVVLRSGRGAKGQRQKRGQQDRFGGHVFLRHGEIVRAVAKPMARSYRLAPAMTCLRSAGRNLCAEKGRRFGWARRASWLCGEIVSSSWPMPLFSRFDRVNRYEFSGKRCIFAPHGRFYLTRDVLQVSDSFHD